MPEIPRLDERGEGTVLHRQRVPLHPGCVDRGDGVESGPLTGSLQIEAAAVQKVDRSIQTLGVIATLANRGMIDGEYVARCGDLERAPPALFGDPEYEIRVLAEAVL